MGFCTDDEYDRFLVSCPDFERMLIRDFPYLKDAHDPGASDTPKFVENPFEKRMNERSI